MQHWFKVNRLLGAIVKLNTKRVVANDFKLGYVIEPMRHIS